VSLAVVLEPRTPLAALAVDPSGRLDPLEKEPQPEEPEHWLMRRLQKRQSVQMTERLSSLDLKRYDKNFLAALPLRL
jgi:hypothetical protein